MEVSEKPALGPVDSYMNIIVMATVNICMKLKTTRRMFHALYLCLYLYLHLYVVKPNVAAQDTEQIFKNLLMKDL